MPANQAPCLMQCGGRIQTLVNIYSIHVPTLRWPAGVCDTCGHVQIARLFEERQYAALNRAYFSSVWNQGGTAARQEGNQQKLRKTIDRLPHDVIRPGGRLLDVGPGEGWSQEVARHLGLEYHVVEAHPELAAQLESRGATVAAPTIAHLRGSDRLFDVIIFRHTLEHVLDPIDSLTTLASALSPEGLLYVVVPDFAIPRVKRGFRTDYLRPVHVSYFTSNKLEWALHRAGLRTDAIHADGELWAAARAGASAVELRNERAENLARFRTHTRERLARDMVEMARIMVARMTGSRRAAG